MALGMTVNGAKDDTKEEILSVLGLEGLTQEEANQSYAKTINTLQEADPAVKLLQANSVWYRNSFQVATPFKQAAENFFGASVEGLDFTKSEESKQFINDWVEEKTEGKINNLIREIQDKHVMFLINALYFKANWSTQFKKEDTYTADFLVESIGQKPVDMMRSADYPIAHTENETIHFIQIPYENGQYNLQILLPKHEEKIHNLVASIDYNKLTELQNSLVEEEVDFHMPKFEITYQKELKGPLQQMGMTKSFTPEEADFNNLFEQQREDYHLTEVFQKVYIKVDEEGTEAAAATSVGVGIESAPMPLIIDRSFLFFITEKHSNTILFEGIVWDPR
ncbi:serpin family protein [Algivirga pacifica]|uniref:Serpin family protein n=2 Tax=Algivirga pacifica TaxID=1162670 RepID=A0ABP9DI37_9BACT